MGSKYNVVTVRCTVGSGLVCKLCRLDFTTSSDAAMKVPRAAVRLLWLWQNPGFLLISRSQDVPSSVEPVQLLLQVVPMSTCHLLGQPSCPNQQAVTPCCELLLMKSEVRCTVRRHGGHPASQLRSRAKTSRSLPPLPSTQLASPF